MEIKYSNWVPKEGHLAKASAWSGKAVQKNQAKLPLGVNF